MDETVSDLEIANEKYNQISVDMDTKTAELEKLRIFKFMVRHAETREESLISKVREGHISERNHFLRIPNHVVARRYQPGTGIM